MRSFFRQLLAPTVTNPIQKTKLQLHALDARDLPAPLVTDRASLFTRTPQLTTQNRASPAIAAAFTPSNTIDVRVVNNTLVITGTPLDDRVEVANNSTVNSNNSAQGTRTDNISASYDSVVFNGFGGNDTFISQSLNTPVTAYGGDGDDTLIGSQAGTRGDLLVGGAGKDTIEGRIGDDIIWGDGVGQISGASPDGTANGSTLADNLQGGEGNDVIYGGYGDDSIRGNDGNDTLNGGANADILDGGFGSDTLQFDGNDNVSSSPYDPTDVVFVDLPGNFKLTATRSTITVQSLSEGASNTVEIPTSKMSSDQQKETIKTIVKDVAEYFKKNSDAIINGQIKASDIGGIVYGAAAGAILKLYAPLQTYEEIAKIVKDLVPGHPDLTYTNAATQTGKYYGAIADDFVSILKGESKPTVANVVGTMATLYFTEVIPAGSIVKVFGVDGWTMTKKVGAEIGGALESAVNEIVSVVDDIGRGIRDTWNRFTSWF